MQPLTLLLLAAKATAQLFGNNNAPATPDTDKLKDLNLKASTHFDSPISSAGIKLVNGETTKVKLSLSNNEDKPVTVQFVGGSLWDTLKGASVKNLTSAKVVQEVAEGKTAEIPYAFTTELRPQDLLLNLALIVTTADGNLVTVSAFNQTVSVVEPELSVFDPQVLFLYLVLLSGLLGSAYFVYSTWIAAMIPKPKRAPRPQPVPAPVTTTTTTASGVSYDQSWIPEHHLKRPATKPKTSTPKAVKGAKRGE